MKKTNEEEKRKEKKNLTNMLRGIKRKKRNKLCICKVNGDRWRRLIHIQDELQGENNYRKGKQMNKCRKKIIVLKKLKVKNIKYTKKEKKMENKKKGKLHKTAKAQCRCSSL